MTSSKNFSGQRTPAVVDDVYCRCNFSQPQPVSHQDGSVHGVRLFPVDNTPRTFLECNLGNCEVPPGSTVEGCNTAIVVRHHPTITEDIVVDGRIVTRVVKEGDVFQGYYDANGAIVRPE